MYRKFQSLTGESPSGGAPEEGHVPSSVPALSLDWWLPGHGEARDDCGRWRFYVHQTVSGESHYRPAKHDCQRFECPVCRGWMVREAEAIERRVLLGMRPGHRPIHVVVSPPPVLWSSVETEEGYRRLRSRSEREAGRCGLVGGAFVFHPLRVPGKWNERDRCAKGPHFHVLGDGWMRPSDRGWVVKNLGVRKSVRETALYLLSHAGQARRLSGILPMREVRSPFAVVVWAGSMAYNRLRGVPDAPDGVWCAVCRQSISFGDWMLASWVGQGPPPTEPGVCMSSDWRAWVLDFTSWPAQVVDVSVT